MELANSLRRLWRHSRFRKLLAIRYVSQTADGTLQVGMASYVLLSPTEQPNAWAITSVLAITLLPFSIFGPFVSVTLDRWSRRQVAVVVEVARLVLSIALAATVWLGDRGTASTIVLYGLLLVSLSLNRYLLAGLSAALPHTIDDDEFLMANSIMPTIGPAGVLVGAGIAASLRWLLSRWMPMNHADAFVFLAAGFGFANSAMLALRFGRHDLGPDAHEVRTTTASEVMSGLVGAGRHLRRKSPALLGLIVIGSQRFLFGMWSVASVLVFRNHFHSEADLPRATRDLVIWAGMTGAGFVASAVLVPMLTKRLGLRKSLVALLLALAVVSVVPGMIIQRWPLFAASFLVGLFSQAIKAGVDTLVQAHVDDDMKGRVFVIYDIIYNVAMVAAAALAAAVLPLGGVSLPVYGAWALTYLGLAGLFLVASHRIGDARFNRGTEASQHAAGPPD